MLFPSHILLFEITIQMYLLTYLSKCHCFFIVHYEDVNFLRAGTLSFVFIPLSSLLPVRLILKIHKINICSVNKQRYSIRIINDLLSF